MITKTLHKFEPGAMSIIQMGEELIGHPSTALGELVKNSYDADALECKVFINIDSDKKKSFMTIADDGLGMDSSTLFGEWLRPSISNKRIGKRKSKVFKRSYLGSKGIGRLASMALGRFLTVITKTSKENKFNWIFIDRELFKDEVLLSKISFPGGQTDTIEEILNNKDLFKPKEIKDNEYVCSTVKSKNIVDFNEGTLILIEHLDESLKTIMKDDFEDAESPFEESTITISLRSLVTPMFLMAESQEELIENEIIEKEFYKKQIRDKFDLIYSANIYDLNFNVEMLPVEPLKIIQEYDYRLIGKFDGNGEIVANYYCQRLGKKQNSPERVILEKEFIFSDEYLRKRRKGIESEDVPEELLNLDVGEFFFDIRVFDRDPDSLDRLTKLLKQPGRLATRRLLDKLVGFRVSKNNFGVKPYGEEDKDWMGLGQMRVQEPVEVLGPNQILGYVFLFSPYNDGLSEKTNREGFYENKAYINLKKILRAVLIDLGRKRAQFRLKHNIGRVIKGKLNRPNTKEFLEFINKRSDDKAILLKSKEFVQEITTTLDNMETTLTFSQRLATLGSGLELVYHELSQPIAQIGGISYSLGINAEKVSNESLKNLFTNDSKILNSALDLLDKLRESLKPAIGISRKKPFHPYITFNNVCTLFTKDINDYQIKIQVDNELKIYEIKDYEYALWIAFLNIINNAVYWLKHSNSDRLLKITIDKKNTIIIYNNGPKIPEDAIDLIFEYGITMKREKNATGLGLAFTRSILNSYDWEIWAENDKHGVSFHIRKKEGS